MNRLDIGDNLEFCYEVYVKSVNPSTDPACDMGNRVYYVRGVSGLVVTVVF